MALVTFSPFTKIVSATMNSNLNGLADGTNDTTANSLQTLRKLTLFNHVNSGCTIPTSANLSSTIASGIAHINGKYVVANTTVKTFTASKDTYVDLKDDGTYAYVEVANGATTGMTLTLNSDGSDALRIAKVVTSGTAVTSVTKTNLDPLGNQIYNTHDDQRYNLVKCAVQGVRFTTSSATFVDVTGSSFVYKSGESAEKLMITATFMADATTGSGEITISIGGVDQTLTGYVDPSASWSRASLDYEYDLPANTSVTIVMRAKINAGSFAVVNENAPWQPYILIVAKKKPA